MSEWKISSNAINNVKMYAAYRIIDATAVDHSGNREYHESGYLESREEVQKIVEELNEKSPHGAATPKKASKMKEV